MIHRLIQRVSVIAFIGLAISGLVACQSITANATNTVNITPTVIAVALQNTVTSVAETPTESVSATSTETPTPAPASFTPIPTNTHHPTATPTNTATTTSTPAPTRISTNIPGQFGGETVTWTPPAPGRQMGDHYLFQRPIDAAYVNYWARNYSYGSTDGGSRPIHHGLDFENVWGTPVIAAGDGTVYYAGDDIAQIFGPQPNFYGNVVVIQHEIVDPQGRKIYTLYGHLSAVEVVAGQVIKTRQEIGRVGSAGVAIGSHLHFEVRLGEPNNYNAVLNPELWIMPFPDRGAIAGRVMDVNGNLLPGVMIEVSQGGQVYFSGYSYADNTVNGDPGMNENYVLPDLPSGYYTVYIRQPSPPNTGDSGTLLFRTIVYVRPGRTNWLDINIDNTTQ